MEFTFETNYDQRATAAMARALRKTVRRKRSRRSHVLGWIVLLLALLLLLPRDGEAFVLDLRTVVTGLAALAMLLALLFEDALNGFFARTRMLDGTAHATGVFGAEAYTTTTAAGKTEWPYETICAIAENADYFVFLFDKNHAQIYDKRGLTGGTADEFRAFIAEKTGKPVQPFGR